METYFNYIIESGISLGVFTLIYWFLLRKEVLLKASRFYLLVAVLFSTLLPFLSINLSSFNKPETIVPIGNEVVLKTNLLETITVTASGFPAKVGQAIVSIKPSMWFYIVGATLALFFLVTGIAQLLSIISHNRRFRLKMARLIISSKAISPYSFFNYIFISRELPEQENWKAIVHHELEHVRQGHSFDVLFVDFMMVFQWFNPFYWIIRRLVRENHEFLADRAVIQRGNISTGNYKALLLSQAIGGRPVMTSNFFNVKTIQKRFKMITKNKTGKYSFLKYAFGVMAAMGLTLCFAINTSAKTDKTVIYKGEISSKEKLLEAEVLTVQAVEMDAKVTEVAYPNLKGQLPDDKVTIAFDATNKEQMEEFQEIIQPAKETSKSDSIVGWEVYVTQEEYIQLFPNTKKEDMPTGIHKKQIFIRENNSEEMAKAKRLNLNLDPKKKMTIVKYETYNTPILKNDGVFVMVEVMPEFPDGEQALRKWIAENVKYPIQAAGQGIQGKVYITFVVEKDGGIGRAQIARGVDPSLDAEALRVVNAMPKWKPGKQGGKDVAVSYTIPINFALDNGEKGKKIDETVVVGYDKKGANTNDSIYNECEEMPVFAGGDLGVRKYIAENIKYPAEARKYGEQGKVYVTFVVAKDGAVEKVRVVRGVTPALDNEAIRVVTTMPNWAPGKNKGEPINVQYTIPVNFQLQ
jgi:TonB family protein